MVSTPEVLRLLSHSAYSKQKLIRRKQLALPALASKCEKTPPEVDTFTSKELRKKATKPR